MNLNEKIKLLDEKINTLKTQQQKLEQYSIIQMYIKNAKKLEEQLQTKAVLNRIQYSMKASCYYNTPVPGSEIFLNGVQRINLSMILARIFIEKYQANIKNFNMITLEELEEYSKIVNRKLTEEKFYEDDPINEEESKLLQISIYKNPANNISYIFNNDSRSKKALKKELERGLHNISENINTDYLDQGYIVLNNNVPIELLIEKYNLGKVTSRIKEALSSPQSLKTIKIEAESPKKKVYHQ